MNNFFDEKQQLFDRLDNIAKRLNMAPVEVYGVVSFYKNFSTVPTV